MEQEQEEYVQVGENTFLTKEEDKGNWDFDNERDNNI